MKRRLAARMTGTVVLAAGTVAALTMPATATPQQPAPASPQAKASTMLEAMQRDLGLNLEQAQQRLSQETTAEKANKLLQDTLAGTFGGSHYDAGLGKLVVGVTDKASFDDVRSAGAEARLVDDSATQLEAAADALNRQGASVPTSVTGWYVDNRTNSVVVTTAKGTAAKASDFVRSTKADAQAVRVVESPESPRTYADIVGGNAYYIGSGARCSIGFAVQGGFVSAGHCGNTGDSTSQPSGTFEGSVFPGSDYSYISSSANPTPTVNGYGNGNVTVAGSQEAAQGASVCRSGSTTGWHCGTIQGKNQTVRYPQGTVQGLTRTDVCAEPGDSGGSFVSGDQAQGMTSGGSGDCTQGGTTYFQPVGEVLSAYNLSLVTG